MRKTKIVCTLGPASADADTIRALIDAGMDVARLNFSHGTPELHGEVLRRVREAERSAGREVAVLQDLPGPKIRTGAGAAVELVEGAEVVLSPGSETTTPERIGCTYAGLARDVSAGDTVLLSDGFLELEVLRSNPEDVRCRVVRGGILRARQGINIPGVALSARPPTEEDLRFIRWGLDAGVDYVALSFVKEAADVIRAREAAGARDVGFVAKIERAEALEDIDNIIDAADAIMLARGDLGVELAPERVPHLQRDIIRRANAADKPVITATQMFESMIEHARPTRAEVSDVAHAVWDGSDAVMLSGETASGKHPVEAVRLMARVAAQAERQGCDEDPGRTRHPASGAEDVVGMAAELVARHLDAKAIVAATMSGDTARFASMARPACPVLGLSPDARARRRMALYRGVVPLVIERMTDSGAVAVEAAKAAVELGVAGAGDLVVAVFGEPVGSGARANTVRLVRIGT